jgi:hypothetical protein
VTAAYVPSLDQTELTCTGTVDAPTIGQVLRYDYSHRFTQPGRASGNDWQVGDARVGHMIMGVDPKRNRKQ